MTEVADNDSPSWLKQRSAVLKSPDNGPKSPKIVDKELARLKSRGGVSSVWSNKFVQEDNSGGRRPSYSSKSSSPTNENFQSRIRTLSGNKAMADDISTLLQSRKSTDLNKPQPSINSLVSRLSKNSSLSSLDLNETTDDAGSPTEPAFRPMSPSLLAQSADSLKTKYDECHAHLKRANQDLAFYKQQEAEKSKLLDSTNQQLADLSVQYDTLKSRFAQTESELKQALADSQTKHQSSEAALEEQNERVRQLVDLILKQDELLKVYEFNLESFKDKSVDQAELADLRQLRLDLTELKKQKDTMESTISSLSADLEMRQGQMRLMMAVSLEMQNELEGFKEKKENEIKDVLAVKEAEHLEELNSFKQRHIDSRSSGQEVDVLNQQLSQLKLALKARDKTIEDMQFQLRNQRMSMDAQMMELTESILEKDALLMEFMSSGRNNSREVIGSQQQHPQPYQPYSQQVHPLQYTESSRHITSSTAPEIVTSSYYHAEEEVNTPRGVGSKTQEFIYSESEDDDNSDILLLNYSTDDEEHNQRNGYEQYEYYNRLKNLNKDEDMVSSHHSSMLSYESSSDEEKVAEIKRFSYTSTRPVSMISSSTRPASVVYNTRPVSMISSTGVSISSAHSDFINTNKRISGNTPVRFSIIKEANWPMPPPTPPPSDPLPPVPPHAGINSNYSSDAEDMSGTVQPPPRRTGSRTATRYDYDEESRLIASAPVPPPRKAYLKLNAEKKQTTWMDDPDSEEDSLAY